jgi:hypothetical protein
MSESMWFPQEGSEEEPDERLEDLVPLTLSAERHVSEPQDLMYGPAPHSLSQTVPFFRDLSVRTPASEYVPHVSSCAIAIMKVLQTEEVELLYSEIVVRLDDFPADIYDLEDELENLLEDGFVSAAVNPVGLAFAITEMGRYFLGMLNALDEGA